MKDNTFFPGCLLPFFLLFITYSSHTQSVGINTTAPDPSAALDVSSTTQGILVPRLSSAQRTAVSSPATGLLVFDSSTGSFWFYTGTAWTELVGGGSTADNLGNHTATQNVRLNDNWLSNDGGNEGIWVTGAGEVGIGASNPSSLLHVSEGVVLNSGTYGSGSSIPVSGAGSRMFYVPRMGAFRAGRIDGTQWNTGHVGDCSAAFGNSNTASGFAAFAAGEANTASGDQSISVGNQNTASGDYSGAMGKNNISSGSLSFTLGQSNQATGSNTISMGTGLSAPSFGEVAVGIYNTTYAPSSVINHIPTDRIFSVGCGASQNNLYDGIVVLKSGNVGIGASSPGQKLEVAGTTKTTNLQITNGATNGYVLKSDASGNAGWVNSTTLANGNWTTSGTDQYSALSGNVGIGTSSPGQKLEVNGTTKTTNLQLTNGATNGYVLKSDASGNAGWVNSTTLANGNWTTSGTNQYSALSGNVGIGTTSPGQKLEVAGTTKTTNLQITSGATNGYVLKSDASGNAGWVNSTTLANGNWTTSGTNQYSALSGNVGIGTSSPSALLHVSEGVVLNSGTFGSGSSIPVSGAGSRMFFVPRTGAFRAGRVDGTQWNNSSVGDCSAAFGNSNTASGFAAFAVGEANTASGDQSVSLGNQNTASGQYSGAIGKNNISSGSLSFTLGQSNQATGTNTISMGTGLSAPSFGEVAVGIYNTTYTPSSTIDHSPTDRIFSVGCGASQTSQNNGIVVLKSGNVGIGASSPGQKLEVNGTTKTTNLQITNGATNGYILKSDASGNASWVNSTTLVSSNWTTSGNNQYSALSGNVGIGTSSPGQKLSVSGNTYISGNLGIGNSNPSSKLAVSGDSEFSGSVDISSDVKVSGILSIGSSGSSNNKLNVGGSAYIAQLAIGGGGPEEFPLTVGAALLYDGGGYGYLNGNGNTGHSSGENYFSIYAINRIGASEFNAFSDARIKKIRGLSDSRADLQTLLNIEVTDYQLKDSIARGNNVHKKVIAQQVEKVYPQAVARIKDVVPDIYQLSEIKKGRIKLKDNTLQKGDRVRLVFGERMELVSVTAADTSGFSVDLPDEGSVFVFGREVSDFRTVDYEALAMLNVSATQELVKMIRVQNETIENLTNANRNMQSDIDRIKAALNIDWPVENQLNASSSQR